VTAGDAQGGGATFPFTAVVGQDQAKLALLLVAVEPRLGGVLLRGAKGSAKTTLARGLAALLPSAAPFVELPVGTTEDRLVGSLDLAAALTGGELRFAPGLLAAAHGGVLYVDEVNLLPDHLVDVLLDVAASGVNRVEREGVSHGHPSRFVLIGSMNPEEGELRPQLLDRFGLAADIGDVGVAERADAVRRRIAFDDGPASFAAAWQAEERALADRLASAAPVAVPPTLLDRICALCSAVGAEGLRADLAITRAAAALAGFEGRSEADADDLRRVAPLALVHRQRRHPLDDPGEADDALRTALGRAASDDGPDAAGEDTSSPAAEEDAPGGEERPPSAEGTGRERVAAPGAPWPVARLEAPRTVDAARGRRSMTTGPAGRLVGDRPAAGTALAGGVAVAATVRAAAARQAPTVALAPSPRATPPVVRVAAEDLREAVREQRAANLVVLAVDASGSMGADRRMEAAKGALLGLLLDAYQRRDRVALVTFRGEGADVVLRPTGSVEVARARLSALATGGRTPLAAGIDLATRLAVESGRTGNHRPLLVLVTDGRATTAGPGADPLAAARAAARSTAAAGIPSVVVDAEDAVPRLGLAAELAAAMGARLLPLSELSAARLRSFVVRT